MKYSDCLFGWLRELGFSHVYFVAGGNIMHLLDSARRSMVCVATVHEVAAAIAVEYHNATLRAGGAAPGIGRALALVTAGPGLTNTITGLAGAWLESRELLLLGGQAKVQDLAPPGLRQLGIQEVDGVALAAPLCKRSRCLREPLPRGELVELVEAGRRGRPGPVFLELPLDVQAAPVPDDGPAAAGTATTATPTPQQEPAADPELPPPPPPERLDQLAGLVRRASRPVLLLGGGLSRPCAQRLEQRLAGLTLPVMTTWNGADRYGADHDNHFGRPNTWGMRFSNVLLQQADLLVAVGSRLGLQQTGFNWGGFLPLGEVIQVDLDAAELAKPNPRVAHPLQAEADGFLEELLRRDLGEHEDWLTFCREVRQALPLSEACNTTADGYLNPYDFVLKLSAICGSGDHIVPCSSGGAFTVMMQAFRLLQGQTMITDKGLASMGYGLSGAIGGAIADPHHRTVLVEGDGGFTQNLQELATVQVNRLNLKIFLFCNEGYASIRMTQRNYFQGAYLGCDTRSGLGFPSWPLLARAYGIPCLPLGPGWWDDPTFLEAWNHSDPAIFLVPLDPEQSYFPKISSRISASGGMESNPLHRMSPDLPAPMEARVLRFLQRSGQE